MRYTQIQEITQQGWNLLLDADPWKEAVARYLQDGTAYGVFDDGQLVCIAVVVPTSQHTCELKNISTDPQKRGLGIASNMIAYLCGEYSRRGYTTMEVGTSTTGDGSTIPFYQRNGFVPDRTIDGFFLSYPFAVIDDDGRQCIDMLMLSRSI